MRTWCGPTSKPSSFSASTRSRLDQEESMEELAELARTDGLVVAGTVHDFSQAPAWQEGVVYGYVSRETMATTGLLRSTGNW